MRGFEMWDGWGGMGLGPLLMFAIPLLLILLFIWLVRSLTDGSGQQNRTQSPHEILDQRFARGEIDEEEYQRRRKALDA